MKKIIITLAVALISLSGIAQINQQALGLRFGGGTTLGGEISYQHALSNENRLEADLGLYSHSDGNGFSLTGIYQWVWALEGGFNWYAGPGAVIGSWHHNNDYKGSDGVYLGIGGQVGAEYNFSEIPFMISLDVRPMWGFGNVYNSYNLGLGLGVRYVF